MEQKPEDAWDISENQDGSVYAWLNTDSETKTLNIAADGEIIANIDCENLFRLCSHVKKIDFNNCFDTSQGQVNLHRPINHFLHISRNQYK